MKRKSIISQNANKGYNAWRQFSFHDMKKHIYRGEGEGGSSQFT